MGTLIGWDKPIFQLGVFPFLLAELFKILLLTLLPRGMTETAAEEITSAVQLNLFNTNHFTVVGPSEWNAQIEERDPSLADCYDIACGVLIGKLFNADKVLIGSIMTKEIFNEENKNIQEKQQKTG